MRQRVATATTVLVRSPHFVGLDEVPAAADSLPVATVTDHTGATLAAPAVATTTDTGIYTAQLTAAVHTAAVAQLTVTWSAPVATIARTVSATIDVVSDLVITLPELRALPGLTSTTDYPSATLREVRDEVLYYAEDYLHRGLASRVEVLDGARADCDGLLFTRFGRIQAVIAATIAGAAATVTAWRPRTVAPVIETYRAGLDALPVAVTYRHGAPCPPKLRRELLRFVRRELVIRNSRVSADVLSETVDGLQTRYALPDRAAGRPTGILALDPILAQYDETALVA